MCSRGVIHLCVGDLTQQDEEERIVRYLRTRYKHACKRAGVETGRQMNMRWMSWASHAMNIITALEAFGVDMEKEEADVR